MHTNVVSSVASEPRPFAFNTAVPGRSDFPVILIGEDGPEGMQLKWVCARNTDSPESFEARLIRVYGFTAADAAEAIAALKFECRDRYNDA